MIKTIYKERVKEIEGSLDAFSDSCFYNNKVFLEVMKLQDEAVNLVFDPEEKNNSRLRIYDVVSKLEAISIEKTGIVIDEVVNLRETSKQLENYIRATISGRKGERIVFNSLRELNCKNAVLRNVELTDGARRTEIDALVITQKGVFIIEVKNTKKNIFISEAGVYYRRSEYLSKEGCIGEKMDFRKRLVKEILEKSGVKNPVIEKVVVFTNDNIEVQNRCKDLTISFVDYLPTLIEEHKGEELYSRDDIFAMKKAMVEAQTTQLYPAAIEAINFKKELAIAIAALESIEENTATKKIINDIFASLKEEVNKSISVNRLKSIAVLGTELVIATAFHRVSPKATVVFRTFS